MRLSALAAEYLAYLEAEDKTEDTLTTYRYALANCVTAVGDLPANELTADRLKAYLASKKQAGAKAGTIYVHAVVLRGLLKWAHRAGYMPENLSDELRVGGQQHPLRRFLGLDEISQLFAACRNPKERLILGLGLFAGLRSIEMFRLTKDDLRPGAIRLFGKGNRPRMVPLSPDLARLLNDYLATYPVNGGPILGICRGSIKYVVTGVGKRAGVRVSPHVLRHTFATFTFRNSDILTVQQLLGHSQISTTAIYLHSDPERLAGAVANLPYSIA